jgi:hypothetical protein
MEYVLALNLRSCDDLPTPVLMRVTYLASGLQQHGYDIAEIRRQCSDVIAAEGYQP